MDREEKDLRRLAIRNSWNQKCFNQAFNDFDHTSFSSDDTEVLSDEDVLKDILSTSVPPQSHMENSSPDEKCCNIL